MINHDEKGHVTICIPAYNCETFIHNAIDALQRQSYESWRAILSLDVSSDRSEDTIRNLIDGDSRFELVIQKARLGWIGNVNYTFTRVQTKFYMLHLHDDYLSDNYLQVLMDHASKHPEIKARAGAYSYDGSEKNKPAQSKLEPCPERIANYLAEGGSLPFKALIRLDDMEAPHLLVENPTPGFPADIIWAAELLAKGTFQVCPEAKYHKWFREEGVTGGWKKFTQTQKLSALLERYVELQNATLRMQLSEIETLSLQASLYSDWLNRISKLTGSSIAGSILKIKYNSVLPIRNQLKKPFELSQLEAILESNVLENSVAKLHENEIRSSIAKDQILKAKELLDLLPEGCFQNERLLCQILQPRSAEDSNNNTLYFQKIQQTAANDPKVLHLLSQRMQQVGALELSLEAARMASALEPKSPHRIVRLAALLMKCEDFVGADTLLSEVIERNPNFANALYHKALLENRKGNTKLSLEFAIQAANLKPRTKNFDSLVSKLRK